MNKLFLLTYICICAFPVFAQDKQDKSSDLPALPPGVVKQLEAFSQAEEIDNLIKLGKGSFEPSGKGYRYIEEKPPEEYRRIDNFLSDHGYKRDYWGYSYRVEESGLAHRVLLDELKSTPQHIHPVLIEKILIRKAGLSYFPYTDADYALLGRIYKEAKPEEYPYLLKTHPRVEAGLQEEIEGEDQTPGRRKEIEAYLLEMKSIIANITKSSTPAHTCLVAVDDLIRSLGEINKIAFSSKSQQEEISQILTDLVCTKNDSVSKEVIDRVQKVLDQMEQDSKFLTKKIEEVRSALTR